MIYIRFVKKIHFWMMDNVKRPSTWLSFLCLFLGYYIFTDKEIFHELLKNIVSNDNFISMLVGFISGGLFTFKKAKEKEGN